MSQLRSTSDQPGQQSGSGEVKIGDIPAYPDIGEFASSRAEIIDIGLGTLVGSGASRHVLEHGLVTAYVADLLCSAAEKSGRDLDLSVVVQAALLHDIGRTFSKGVDHGIRGAEYLARLGFSSSVCLAVERHVGAGITASQAKLLGLPERDYVPLTLEEKLVSFADKLVEGVNVLGPDHVLARFRKEFGEGSEQLALAQNLVIEMRPIYEVSKVPSLIGWKSPARLSIFKRPDGSFRILREC